MCFVFIIVLFYFIFNVDANARSEVASLGTLPAERGRTLTVVNGPEYRATMSLPVWEHTSHLYEPVARTRRRNTLVSLFHLHLLL